MSGSKWNTFSRRGIVLRSVTGVTAASMVAGMTLIMQGCPFLTPPPPATAITASISGDSTVDVNQAANLTANVTGATGNLSFVWSVVSGGGFLANSSLQSTAYTNTSATSAVVQVDVSDAGTGTSASAQFTVTVQAPTTPPTPTPTALTVDAGADQTANGGDTVNLTALVTAGNTDPTSFAWQQTASGTAGGATMSPADGAGQTLSVTFSSDAAGTFTYQVTATDSQSPTPGTGQDSVSVTVTPSASPADTTFTLNIDNLAGTSNDDTFSAPLDVINGPATNPQTLQTGDQAVGGGGNDTLNVFFQNGTGGALAITPTLAGIGVLNISDFSPANGTTLSLAGSTGVTTINSVTSTFAVTVTNIPDVVNAGITNSAQNLSLTFANAATNGPADTIALTLSNITDAGGTFEITTAANGFETLNIDSIGGENSLAALTQTTGTTLATVNVTGDQKLTINGALPGTVTALDASGQTAGGTVASTTAVAAFTFTGGPGDDAINFGGTYDDSTDAATGGAGTDTIGFTSAAANGIGTALTNASGFEILEITDALAGDVDETLFNLNSTVNLPAGFGAGVTLTVASGDTVALGDTVFGSAKVDSAAAGTITVGGVGTTDVVTVILSDHDSASNLITTGVETLNIQSNINVNGAAADGGGVNVIAGTTAMTPTFGSGTINITGDEDLTLTGVVSAGTIDASTFGQALTLTGGTSIASTITGGSGDDVLNGSAVQDSISGGDGNDTLDGRAGVDQLAGGNGNDTFLEDESAAIDLITDWADGSDTLTISSTNTDFDAGSGLAQGGGAAASLAATVAGATTIKSVAQNAAASAIGAGDQFIKLTTAVAAAASDQLTFDAAIGTATVTGLTATTNMAGSYYDSTNGQMVVFEVASDAGVNTTIETGDAIAVICKIAMSATDYTNFTKDDLAFIDIP